MYLPRSIRKATVRARIRLLSVDTETPYFVAYSVMSIHWLMGIKIPGFTIQARSSKLFFVLTIDFSKKKKIGLVCSGGAVKAAAFHVGVALALERKGFRFLGGPKVEANDGPQLDPSKTVQVYVGSSAGSLIGTYLAQGGKLKDMVASFVSEPSTQGIPGLKYWEMLYPRVRSARDFLSLDNFFFSMLKNRKIQSPFSTQGICNYLRNHIIKTEKFSELEADLFIVATELNQSRKCVFGKYLSAPADATLEYRNDVSISDACAGSMALPPIYHPYSIQIDGARRDYFDGEIREPLSSHIARDNGCDLIICSYTHQPLRIHPSSGTLADKNIQDISLQAISQAIEQKIQGSRNQKTREKAVLDNVKHFFAEKMLDSKIADELLDELEARMTYKRDVDYIYIRPRATDQSMFYSPHFSLDRRGTERVVKKGFLAGMTALESQGLK